MRVAHFSPANPRIASYRYRVQIPAGPLAGMGIEVVNGWETPDADVVVFSKHLKAGEREHQGPVMEALERATAKGVPVVVDVCDDHFCSELEWFYRALCSAADAVVVPTEGLAETVLAETGKQARVVPDPYEFPEAEPRVVWPKRLFWYGHKNNFGALSRELPRLSRYLVRAVGNVPGAVAWSHQAMLDGFTWCDVVILPTRDDRKYQSKSSNRMVEAIRQGRYVVANPMPAWSGYGMWQGDILEGLKWVAQNQQEALSRVRTGQELIRSRHSPESVARQWKAVFDSISGAATKSSRVSSTSTRRRTGRAERQTLMQT